MAERTTDFEAGRRAAIRDVLAEFDRPVRAIEPCAHDADGSWTCTYCLRAAIHSWLPAVAPCACELAACERCHPSLVEAPRGS